MFLEFLFGGALLGVNKMFSGIEKEMEFIRKRNLAEAMGEKIFPYKGQMVYLDGTAVFPEAHSRGTAWVDAYGNVKYLHVDPERNARYEAWIKENTKTKI